MRKAILFIHKWLGIIFGVLISMLCLTGAIMVFQDEIIHALNRSKYHLIVPADATRLSDEELSQRVQEQLPPDTKVMFIEVSDSDPTAPANAMVQGLGHVDFLINPYTGEVYGKPVGTDFFVTVKQLHRFLLNVPQNYQGGGFSVGRLIIGMSAIAMTLILLTGIFLWFPRNKKQIKNRFTIDTHHGAKRLIYDSHVSLGIYVVIFLLLMSLTGPAWSFKWYNKAAQAVTGYAAQEQVVPQGMGQRPLAGFNDQQGSTIQIKHSEVERQAHPDIRNFHMFLQRWHFGQWAGWLSKFIYLLAALIGATLPWTGYCMIHNRLHKKS